MAASREKRVTAGNKMSTLLEAEDEDEFYKTMYGGFEEEAEDKDYQSEGSGHDEVDSDFDIDETDELKSDVEDDEKTEKRKRGINTKAYKEPAKKSKKEQDKEHKKKTSAPKQKRVSADSSVRIYNTVGSIDKKSLRRSTAMKTMDAEMKRKTTAEKTQMMKELAKRKNVAEVRRLTQEELLAEAKITEEINLKTLDLYQKMELEKKKNRVTKQTYRGPMVKYQSFTMPVIEEISSGIVVDGEVDKPKEQQLKKSTKNCSRNFVTFTDENTFNEYFTHKRYRKPIQQYCPVTRLPAKYFDPLTQTPYANAQAFKVIRDAYNKQLESNVDRKRARIEAV